MVRNSAIYGRSCAGICEGDDEVSMEEPTGTSDLTCSKCQARFPEYLLYIFDDYAICDGCLEAIVRNYFAKESV